MSTTFGAMMFPTDYAIQPIELARAIEERGLDSMYFPEHTHIPVAGAVPGRAAATSLRSTGTRTTRSWLWERPLRRPNASSSARGYAW